MGTTYFIGRKIFAEISNLTLIVQRVWIPVWGVHYLQLPLLDCVFVGLFVCLFVCLTVCLFVCRSVNMSGCFSVCVCVCLSVYLFVCSFWSFIMFWYALSWYYLFIVYLLLCLKLAHKCISTVLDVYWLFMVSCLYQQVKNSHQNLLLAILLQVRNIWSGPTNYKVLSYVHATRHIKNQNNSNGAVLDKNKLWYEFWTIDLSRWVVLIYVGKRVKKQNTTRSMWKLENHE